MCFGGKVEHRVRRRLADRPIHCCPIRDIRLDQLESGMRFQGCQRGRIGRICQFIQCGHPGAWPGHQLNAEG